ncbi:PH domain-containing protein [Streptomyces avicenniae]|uniref:PH domain-containing protein n=1 Tax=Streptomyces avicenniae TaxID=500153 RepID=UPI00069C50F9|nr:PH domain-containing protein [Streptomyces avicenniae]
MSEPQKYADRAYRSGSAIVGGVLLLALAAWLGTDAILRGDGRTPLVALSGLVFAVPLIVAFSVRPAAFASDERLRVRNPFRTVTLPWSRVETVRARYSSEVVADGRTYQIWSIPVSLRGRNRANRRREQAESGRMPRSGRFGTYGTPADDRAAAEPPGLAAGDAAIAELRDLAERHREKPGAQGDVEIRWSLETLIPLAAGAVALLVLWLTR